MAIKIGFSGDTVRVNVDGPEVISQTHSQDNRESQNAGDQVRDAEHKAWSLTLNINTHL